MKGLVGGRVVNITTGESMSLPTYEFDTMWMESGQVAVLRRLWRGEIPWSGLTYLESFIASEQTGFSVVRRMIDPGRGAVDELFFNFEEVGFDLLRIDGSFSADAVAFFGFNPLQIVNRGPDFIMVQSPFLGYFEARITVCDASRCGDQPFKAKYSHGKGATTIPTE